MKQKIEKGMSVYISDNVTEEDSVTSTGARFIDDEQKHGWVVVDEIGHDGDFFIKGYGEYLWYSPDWIDWNKTNGAKLNKSRRPERERPINNNDTINLIIAMETAKSMEEFLEMV